MLAPFRRAKSPPKIRKVFVLMLENRSFDHMLSFTDLSGTDAMDGTPTSADNLFGKALGQPPFANPFGGPVSPDDTAPFKIPKTDNDHHEDPGHEFMDVLKQLSYDPQTTINWDDKSSTNVYPPITSLGFVQSHSSHWDVASNPPSYGAGSKVPPDIMKCFSPQNVPVLTKLAQEFAVCDRWFSSMPGPTWPNRFFLHAASSGGLDDSPTGVETTVASLVDGFRFAKGTIFDRLDESCIDWRIFEGDEFPQVFAISGMDLNALEGRYTDFEDFASEVADPGFTPAYVFIEPNYGNILPTTGEDFTCGTSQHPLDDVTRGERLIKQVYEAIRSSPHWETSALVITYDEHGGFFDHVPPPGPSASPPAVPAVVPPGDAIASSDNNHHNFQFDQLGVRVPAVVVSPLIPRATIDHTRYDHSSVSRTLGLLFGMKTLTNRDAAANDFLHLFSLTTPRTDTPATLPEPAPSSWPCEPRALTDLTDASDTPASESDDGSSSSSALTGTPTSDQRATEQRPVPSSFWGFMRVALRKALLTIPPGPTPQRRQLIQQFLDVRTGQDARRFIHESRLRVRRSKGLLDEWRPLQMRRPSRAGERSDNTPPRGQGPADNGSTE